MAGSELRMLTQSRKDAEESRSIPTPTFATSRLCVVPTALDDLKKSLLHQAFSGNL